MKKKIIALLLITTLIVSVYPTGVFGATTTKKISIKLKSIICVINSSVGQQWGFVSTVNKKRVTKGNTITISVSSTGKLTIISKATENDTRPDFGSKTLSIAVKGLSTNVSKTYTSKVTVTENAGRYSGNTAVWKFTYVVTKK